MNTVLSEINGILSLCEAMVKRIKESGALYSPDQDYDEYRNKINKFMESNGLKRKDYGPYAALDALWFPKNRSYTLNLSEARTIKGIVADLKHELYPNSFEKIFISHREKDKEQVAALVDLLYAIGIPRPTQNKKDEVIFCTLHPDAYIENGKENLEEIKNKFNSTDHTFYILWYTDNYFESQACLNEAGAIWAMNKKYQEILAPQLESSKIGGLMDKQKVWFRANNTFRLNTFKKELESMFDLDPLEINTWEIARREFVSKIEKNQSNY